jgi:predicted amidohydrolase YtcJ
VIKPKEAGNLLGAVAGIVAFAKQYDGGAITRQPGITVRNAKLFLDGVIAAPALTGAVSEPYLMNAGTAEKPRWVPGPSRGPAVYFSADALATVLVELGRAGIDPHMHADGDGAVQAALDGIEALRKALPTADIRPAIAHDEIVEPADFPRYKLLGAIPVLSFQWEKPAGDTLGLTNRDKPGSSPSRPLYSGGALGAFVRVTPTLRANHSSSLSTGQSLPKAMRAPAAARSCAGSRIFIRAGPK